MNIIWEFSINLMFSRGLFYLHVDPVQVPLFLIFWCISFFHYALLQHFPFSPEQEDLSLWVTCYF